MLDGIEPGVVRELKHAVEHAAGSKDVSNVRARYIGHRLQGEVMVAVDPSLTVAESLATTGRYLAALRADENPHADALAALFGLDTE